MNEETFNRLMPKITREADMKQHMVQMYAEIEYLYKHLDKNGMGQEQHAENLKLFKSWVDAAYGKEANA